MHSLKVQKDCRDCDLRRRKMAGTMSKLKLAMKELNDTVTRLRKRSTTEDVEEKKLSAGSESESS
jgi:hypothetical protein